jgi:hypothetical protein
MGICNLEPKNTVSCERRIKILMNDNFIVVLVDQCPASSEASEIPINTCDTTKMGMVCHRYGNSATVPVPIKPAGHLPWVYPYPCYTLNTGDTLTQYITNSLLNKLNLKYCRKHW